MKKKKVFLDLGTHFGQGMRDFIRRFRMNESWEIHTFEANPITHKIFIDNYIQNTPWVISHLEAISDHNGNIDVNIEKPPGEQPTGQGTSVISLDVWDPWGNNTSKEKFETVIEVPCIDLSEFIKDNFSKEDFIVVKMDIEGSEYDTLQKLIDTNVITYINHIVVEWHSHYFKNKEEIENREILIKEQLSKYNLIMENWK